MVNENDFFQQRNTVNRISDEDKSKPMYYLEAVKAFARTTNQSIYVIDYQTKGFEYVSENPLFLCGHSAEEVKKMGYAFYFKYVTPEDIDLLLKINNIGFDFYEDIAKEERLLHTISYDFHLKNSDNKVILVNQKLTPIYLNEAGKIWKAICLVSLSTQNTAGNITISKMGEPKQLTYDLENDHWVESNKIELSDREKEVVRYSIRGYTIDEIAEAIFISPDTVKFHRRKLFEKLDVTNISKAISIASNNNLI